MIRMKSNTKMVISALFVMIIVFSMITPYYANSAQTNWSGVDATGTMITDGENPIVVEHEVLTFDIYEFPTGYYNSREEYLDYSPTVTAEYTFYNPSDYTVSSTLLFPFGRIPDYGQYFYSEDITDIDIADADKYCVEINGEKAETVIRHTYSHRYQQFQLENDLSKVTDGYYKDDFYTPDTPVYCLTYELSGIRDYAATAALEWRGNENQTKILVENQSGCGIGEDNIQLTVWVHNEESICVWIFGEYEEIPQWTLYKNGACEEMAQGVIKQTPEITTMTFREFVLKDYDWESGISQSDWYNAKVHMFNESEWKFGAIYADMSPQEFKESLLCWYQYEITLEPGQRVKNTVTAPLYPGINANYDPDIYNYTYLLSPATTWSEFGSLEIHMNTPYYLTKCSVSGYEKTDSGYCWSLPGLPEGELEFTLCTEENPVERNGLANLIGVMIVGVGLLTVVLWIAGFIGFALVAAIIVFVIMFFVHRHKRKGRGNSADETGEDCR